jgi:hypothetical membrane protein
MKEKAIGTTAVGLLASLVGIFIGGTDAIYVVVSVLFFGLCIAYAEWCQRL